MLKQQRLRPLLFCLFKYLKHYAIALEGIVPKHTDYYDLITLTGVFAGIGYYLFTHDSWLLVTFLGLLSGSALERSRSRDKSSQ
jgi:hypothetical protein